MSKRVGTRNYDWLLILEIDSVCINLFSSSEIKETAINTQGKRNRITDYANEWTQVYAAFCRELPDVNLTGSVVG